MTSFREILCTFFNLFHSFRLYRDLMVRRVWVYRLYVCLCVSHLASPTRIGCRFLSFVALRKPNGVE